MKKTRLVSIFVLLIATQVSGTGVHAAATPTELASRLYARLTGLPLSLSAPQRVEMERAISEGRLLDAAKVATEHDAFYNVTLRHWSSSFGNRAEITFSPLDDVSAMMIGTVRDDRDFREILSGDFAYAANTGGQGEQEAPAFDNGNNQHFIFLENQRRNLRKELKRIEPQNARNPDAAGVLTSRAWAAAHLLAGTNRRAIEYTFRQFLCTPLQEMRDATLPDSRVHRDVDRSPGGSSQTYLNTCRSCHAGLDALVGAYAHYRFDFANPGTGLVFERKIQRKMNQNGEVYPEGYVTTDDSWFNQFTQNQNVQFGWRGELQGRGIKQFGQMIANSQAFSKCMVKKVFSQVCNRDILPSETATVDKLAESFEKGGYKLKALFEETAVLPTCL